MSECVLNGFDFFFGNSVFEFRVPAPPPPHAPPNGVGGWGQLRQTYVASWGCSCVTGRPGMAMGVWQWGSSDMRGMSVYGIGVATMGGGEVGYTPTPCVDAGTLHQNRWPEKIRRMPYKKKGGQKKYVGSRFQKCKKPAVLKHLKITK